MAKLIIQCENCGEEREVDERMAGSTLACAGCGETIRIPIPDIGEGVTLGGFVLEKQLGFGAMGEVWLAHQQAMDRKVALKLLSREFTMDSQFVDRFLKEVRMSAKMDHPNIITAFDAGCDKDIHYLAISFVDGCDLDQRLGEVQILPEKEALKIVREISTALCYAWNDFKILHRDIKPSNIMIDKKGVAKLMDMGISKSVNEEAQLTMTGTVIGTPYYMSPEQGMGEKALDCRSDIYSLGATLYHLVTGSLPFEATTAIGIISKHITEPLPSPQNVNPDLSDQCTALLEIMMAKGTDDRQQTWEEVIKDIDMVLADKNPVSKHRPDAGDSVIMRAITDEDIPAASHAKQTVVYEDELVSEVPMTASQPQISASQVLEQPITPIVKKSKTPLIVALSIASIIALIAAVLVVFSKEDQVTSDDEFILDNNPFPEDLNPVSDSVIDQPSDPAPPPEHNTMTDPNEKRYSDMWKFASEYAKNNPENYNVAINNFKELSRTAGGSKYKMMADVEINKLQKAMDKAIAAVIDKLHKKAKPLIDKKEFNRASEIYEKYSGSFDQETMDDRIRFANDLLAQGDEKMQLKQEKEDKQRQEMHDTVSRIIEDIIQGNMKNAYLVFKDAAKQHSMPGDIREPLEQLLTINKTVLASFKKAIGKKITLKTPKGSISVTIKKIKGNTLYIELKKGRVVTQKRFPISKLSEYEIIRRSGMNPEAIAMYKAFKFAKAKKLEEAKRYAERVSGELGDIFTEVMRQHYMPEEVKDQPPDNNEPQNQLVNRHDNQREKNFHPDDFRDDLNPFTKQNKTMNGMGSNNSAFAKLQRKLTEVNPDYNGKGRLFVNNGKNIEEVDLFNSPETDNEMLKILAQLPDLKNLDIGRSRVTDLSPLKHTKLEMLNISRCHGLNDISPLKKLKTLRALSMTNTQISDISAVKNMKLEMLDISNSHVEDIRVLKGMPIKTLRMEGCPIKDYSVLKTLKKLKFLEPIHLWEQVPGKEYMAKKRRPRKRRNPLIDFKKNKMYND